MKYKIHTFGCKVNTYDTGLIQKNLNSNGFQLDSGHGKIHVLNTCAVTGEATKEAVRIIRKIKSKDPLATVVVTGCAAQVDTDSFANLPGADMVVANSHKGMLPFLLDQYFKGELKEKVFKSNIFRKDDLEAGGGIEETHTRAFVKIQDGCNSFCSYCIIPYARGKSRSIPIQNLVQRINEIYESGIREVVLTGVHIGDYKDDTKSNFNLLEDLIEDLIKKTKMPRFRLTSLEPVELTERLINLYQEDRLCRHFHMSIQSANTEVLKIMKRQYTQKEVIESLALIQNKLPGSFVGMDVIVGFPNETSEYFEDTYKVLAEAPWTKIHVFPYSERTGTRAAVIADSIPVSERKSRSYKLRELSQHRYQIEALKQVGTIKKTLILKNESRGAQGLSRDYWPIKIENSINLQNYIGQEISLQVTNYSTLDNVLIGSSLQ